MVRWSLATVAVCCACGLMVADTKAEGAFNVRIRVRIDRSIRFRSIAARLKEEAESIWRAYGVQLEWADGDTSEPAAGGISLDVTVAPFPAAAWIERPPILGSTYVTSDTRSLRPIRVSFDAVQNVLTKRTSSGVSGAALVMEPELGRALGRVLAHEIGHVLMNTADHDQAGLMRAAFSADQLAEPDRAPFQLTCRAINRLSERLRELSGSSPPIAQANSASCMAVRPSCPATTDRRCERR